MKTSLTTLSLCALIVCTAHSQTVRPILLLPDSTEAYTVTRPWMEFALRSIELAPLQATALADLAFELLAADEQIMVRDRTISNLENDIGRLGDIVDISELQLGESEAAVEMLDRARKRSVLWGRVTGLTTVVLVFVAILK